MNRIEQFASEHPVAFGVFVTFVYILMVILSVILGKLWPGTDAYGQPGGILGRFISVLILLTVLSDPGLLRPAGFTSLGNWRTWLTGLLLLVYAIGASAYALTGDFGFSIFGGGLTSLVILFVLTAAFLEEVVFRGLVLGGCIRAWGNTNKGMIKSVLVSSVIL
jgi:membrane protease YdiL (CAAX protease family)